MAVQTLLERAKKELGYEASGNLRSVSELNVNVDFDDSASISEWLTLEKAKRLKADFVYFRRQEGRPSQPLIYIYDLSENAASFDDVDLMCGLQRDVWSSAEVPCIFVFSKTEVRVFNTTKRPAEKISENYLIEPALEINDALRSRFSSFQFDSGEFWQEQERDFAFSRSAHNSLLSKLKEVKNSFLKAAIFPNGEMVNRLLIQCVLVRFLEEKVEPDAAGILRKVFPDNFFPVVANAITFQDSLAKGTFVKVFEHLNDTAKLNGQIFKWSEEEKELLQAVDSKKLVQLLYETDVDERSQRSFWELYSFRFIPVEVVSSIYEALFTSPDSVKEDGMVYTPPHLAAFLVDEAMPLSNWKSKEGYKILDPSCGSGIFLVLAFKRMVHWWRLENGGKIPTAKDLLKILEGSVHGIDSNESAVLLSRFSLCLALCEMLTPPEIWDDLHFPMLENQLFNSDFFKWEGLRNRPSFDLVIGNPPFVRSKQELPDWKQFSDVKIPQGQLALYFLCAGMGLLKEKGLLCLVLKSSSILYSTTGGDFRKAFFARNRVRQIIDLTLLARNHVLWPTQEPNTLAIFTSRESPIVSDSILHLVVRRNHATGLRKFFEIDPYDFHWVPYSVAIQEDFIWKINLLGGGRLYDWVRSLKKHPTIYDFIKQRKKQGWVASVGYQTSDNPDKLKSSAITGRLTLPTEWLTEEGLIHDDFPDEESKFFETIRDSRIYKAPHFLIKLGIGEQHSIPICLFSDLDIGFKKQIFGVHAPESEKALLRQVFEKIKSLNSTYRAFLFVSSPRVLVYKNTALLAEDIKNLPFPNNLEENIDFSSSGQILIADVLKYHQEAIRKPETAKSLKSIASRDLPNRLKNFSKLFCSELNGIYKKDGKQFRLQELGTFGKNAFVFISFRYDDQSEVPVPSKVEGLPEISEQQLTSLLTLDKGHVRFQRILKVYQKDSVYFIKPNQLRYWLDSTAMRDADWVIDDLAKNGF